jgi:hypothetical protein
MQSKTRRAKRKVVSLMRPNRHYRSLSELNCEEVRGEWEASPWQISQLIRHAAGSKTPGKHVTALVPCSPSAPLLST